VPAEVSDRELRLLRLRAQHLLPGAEAESVVDAARSCFTIQAQDAPAALLALRARTSGLTAEDTRAEAAGDEVCRAWLMRNTIHLFAAEDLSWMRPLLAERPLRPAMTRFEQLEMDEAAVEAMLDLLRQRLARGQLPRAEARELVIAAGLDPGENNQRIYWLFQVAALRGVLVVSPALDQKQTFVAPAPDVPVERDEGYVRLARRFLEAYGPATPGDLAYWGKVTITDAKRAFANAGELEEVMTSRGPMRALPGTVEPAPSSGPVVRLLPVWENYLLGYEDRALAVPAPHDRMPGAGKPAATADGRSFGHWRIDRGRDSIEIVVEPFTARLPKGVRPRLEAEVADMGRFLQIEATVRLERP
jgi:Winged helix DNA-binding domain